MPFRVTADQLVQDIFITRDYDKRSPPGFCRTIFKVGPTIRKAALLSVRQKMFTKPLGLSTLNPLSTLFCDVIKKHLPEEPIQ